MINKFSEMLEFDVSLNCYYCSDYIGNISSVSKTNVNYPPRIILDEEEYMVIKRKCPRKSMIYIA